jgi:hypothetical protein
MSLKLPRANCGAKIERSTGEWNGGTRCDKLSPFTDWICCSQQIGFANAPVTDVSSWKCSAAGAKSFNNGKTFAPSMPSAGAGRGFGAPQTVVAPQATINVQGVGGTPEGNTDLANKIAKRFEESAKALVADQLRI